jgi:hypothetical protein
MKAAVMLFAWAVTAAAYGQTYKWVDQDGRIRYGDTPPPGANARALKAPSRPPAPVEKKDSKDSKDSKAGDKEKELSPEAAFRKRQQERQEAEQKAEKERADAAQKQQNCASAQTYLRTLQTGQRIVSTDAAGERVYMEEGQRQQAIERAQRSVGEWCK